MHQTFVNYMVKRYFRFDRENPFIFLSGFLAFLGILVGVAVLMVAMAIMNGMEKEFAKRLFTMNYPITIYPTFVGTVDDTLLHRLENKFFDLHFSPYLRTQVLVKEAGKLKGGLLFGVDAEREKQVNPVFAAAFNKSIGTFGMIVGKPLARELHLSEGSKIKILFSKTQPSGMTLLPVAKRFSVEGVFHSGLTAYDERYLYTGFSAFERILKSESGVYDGIHVASKEPMRDIKLIESELPEGVTAVGWWEQNGNFFAAWEMEKRALFIVLMLIILIASLNIVSSLLMTVMSRRSEVALLLTLGASRREIMMLFFKLALIVGIGGILFGVLFGSASLYLLGHFDIVTLPEDVYGTSKLPLALDWQDFAMILVGTFVITLVSAIYPARKAAQTDALQVLRNE